MRIFEKVATPNIRKETDSLGQVSVPADVLWVPLQAKSGEWNDIVKIGRTHMQDATPLALGHE